MTTTRKSHLPTFQKLYSRDDPFYIANSDSSFFPISWFPLAACTVPRCPRRLAKQRPWRRCGRRSSQTSQPQPPQCVARNEGFGEDLTNTLSGAATIGSDWRITDAEPGITNPLKCLASQCNPVHFVVWLPSPNFVFPTSSDPEANISIFLLKPPIDIPHTSCLSTVSANISICLSTFSTVYHGLSFAGYPDFLVYTLLKTKWLSAGAGSMLRGVQRYDIGHWVITEGATNSTRCLNLEFLSFEVSVSLNLLNWSFEPLSWFIMVYHDYHDLSWFIIVIVVVVVVIIIIIIIFPYVPIFPYEHDITWP